MDSKCIAIIPARGGSKRIPKKNIMDFFGKPMIAWTIEAAIQSKIFHRVLVSTDDPEIASVARDYGASVPFFRNACSDDHSPVSQATLSALVQVERDLSESYKTVVQLMPNCPIRNGADIQVAYQHYLKRSASFQISCFKYGWMNPWWAATLSSDGQPNSIFPEAMQMRSQDLDKLYCPTGAIWIAEIDALKNAGTFYGPDHIYCPINWRSAIDIDNYDDLEMAKVLFNFLNRESIKV